MSHTKRLGEILIESGIINDTQLETALHLQQENHKRLGQLIVEMGWGSEQAVCQAVAKVLNLDYVDVADVLLNQEFVRIIPETMAAAHQILPLCIQDQDLYIASEHALEKEVITHIETFTGLHIIILIAPPIHLQQAIQRHYQLEYYVESWLAKIVEDIPVILERKAETEDERSDSKKIVPLDAVLSQLISLLVVYGIKQRAHQIVFLRRSDGTGISYIIDGFPSALIPLPEWLWQPMFEAIQRLSSLPSGEVNPHEQGSFRLTYAQRIIELQVTTHTAENEHVLLMHIRDPKTAVYHLHRLGLSTDHQNICRTILHQPHGWILVTGPAGCGKTSTLYALVNALKGGLKKVFTIESPVEYQLDGVEQFQVNLDVEQAMAKGIRSLLEHRPEALLIGELQGADTARLAARAAESSLVFSPLMVGDAVATIYELFNLGVSPGVVASTLLAVIAQRLVRRICPQCKAPHIPTEQELRWLGVNDARAIPFTCYRGQGCPTCDYTGYYGQIGLYEILVPNDVLRAEIRRPSPQTRLLGLAIDLGLEPLKADGIKKIQHGITTIAEVMRVCPDEQQTTTAFERENVELLPQSNTPQILVAEHDETTRTLVTTLLSRQGYEVCAAYDGDQALQLIRSKRPLLAILASDLPKQTGWAVCQMLRSQVDTLFLPVLMLTQEPSLAEKLPGLASGVTQYLTKPCEPEVFLDHVKFALAQFT